MPDNLSSATNLSSAINAATVAATPADPSVECIVSGLQYAPSPWLVARHGSVVASNASANMLFGYPQANLVGLPLAMLIEDVPPFGPGHQVEPVLAWLHTKMGRKIRALVSAHVFKQSGTLVLLLVDCAHMSRIEQGLRNLAFRDALTGLPNAHALMQHMGAAFAARKTDLEPVGLVLIDVDRLRLVNDAHGHSTGDKLLRKIAQRIKERAHPSEYVAHRGDGQFAVFSAAYANEHELLNRADQFLTLLAAPHELDDRRLSITGSAGAVLSDAAVRSPQQLLRSADVALYIAKDRGRNRCEMFDPAVRATTRRWLNILTALERALRNRELEVHVQPIVDARSTALVGAEALLRWPRHFPDSCGPAEFIPASEVLGIAPEIDRYVIEEAARWLAQLRQSHPALGSLCMNINVSAETLRGSALVELLRSVRGQYRLEAGALRIEITETALLSDCPSIREVLHELASEGTPLVLDDFGTGYSSLRHVHDLPITGLKIDKFFVDRSLRDPRSMALVKSILALASALGIATTAEGVENEDQRITLMRLGCDTMQGYLFARPMPAQDLPEWLDGDGRSTLLNATNITPYFGIQR